MEVLVFAVAVAISAIDPLLMVAYVLAGWAAPNWRWAALFGPLAGAGLLILLVLIRGEGWQPKPFNVAAQLVACAIGAVLVRFLIDRFRSAPSAAGADK